MTGAGSVGPAAAGGCPALACPRQPPPGRCRGGGASGRRLFNTPPPARKYTPQIFARENTPERCSARLLAAQNRRAAARPSGERCADDARGRAVASVHLRVACRCVGVPGADASGGRRARPHRIPSPQSVLDRAASEHMYASVLEPRPPSLKSPAPGPRTRSRPRGVIYLGPEEPMPDASIRALQNRCPRSRHRGVC
jgi:hypothetical protein